MINILKVLLVLVLTLSFLSVSVSAFDWDDIVDSDGDGIVNSKDNCPNVPNPDQKDSNGNGVGDACDLNIILLKPIKISPGLVNLAKVIGKNIFDNPMGYLDFDGDGIVNSKDNCVGIANPDQKDTDGDGLGDVCDDNNNDGPLGDLDFDEILNGVDNCKLIPNTDQADIDGDGFGDACDGNNNDGPLANPVDNPEDPVEDPVDDPVEDPANNPENQIKLEIVDILFAPESITAGETILVQASVKNTGNVEVNDVKVTAGINSVLNSATLNNILVGDTEQTIQIPITTDKCMAAGSYKVKIQVTVGNYITVGEVSNLVVAANDNCLQPDNPALPDEEQNILDTDGDGILNAADNCKLKANPDQKDSDNDGIGDACDGDFVNSQPLTGEEADLKELEDKYYDYKKDFNKYEDKYEEAVDDKDEKDKKKYKKKLNDLDDDLDDLEDEVDDFIKDTNNNILEDQAEELEDDIKNLRKKIDRVLNGTFSSFSSFATSSFVPKNTQTAASVVLEPLNFQAPATTPTVVDNWDNISFYAWTIGGIIILLAVIIFLIALMIK